MSESHEKPGFRTETKRLIRGASDWLEELGKPPSEGALEGIPEVDARRVALHANAVLAAHPESAIDPEQAVELVGFLVDLALFLLYVQDATEDANEHYHDEVMPVLVAEEERLLHLSEIAAKGGSAPRNVARDEQIYKAFVDMVNETGWKQGPIADKLSSIFGPTPDRIKRIFREQRRNRQGG